MICLCCFFLTGHQSWYRMLGHKNREGRKQNRRPSSLDLFYLFVQSLLYFIVQSFFIRILLISLTECPSGMLPFYAARPSQDSRRSPLNSPEVHSLAQASRGLAPPSPRGRSPDRPTPLAPLMRSRPRLKTVPIEQR